MWLMFSMVLEHRRSILFVVLLFISKTAMSADEVEGLGRLFIDPEQREKLESVRRGTYNAEIEQESRVSNVRVNGVMIRGDGENVVWINGKSTLDGAPVKGVNVNPDNADSETYKVQVMIDGKRVNIKPGQNWSERTGTIKDSY